jgi:Tol biopolymer transport system component/DNA-binding winged helix-turn-helix (wHTH) protein
MIYRFADFELDPDQSRLTREGEEVSLQPKVFEALVLLVRSSGQLITKQELMDALWPSTFVNEEALAQVIFKLRRALGDTHGEPRFIQTVLKRGFRFLPEVVKEGAGNSASVDEPDVEAVPAIAGQQQSSFIARLFRPRVVIAMIAVAAIAAAVIITRELLKPRKEETLFTPPPPPRNQRVRRMTYFPERDQDADISPDGKSFAFVSKHEGDGLFKLYVMSTAGGAAVRLTRSRAEETTPRYSPDGQWIAYTRSDDPGISHNIWKVAAMGGQESQLAANAGLPDWSPDGREIIFVRALTSGGYSLARMSLEDRSERQIVNWPGFIDMPAWSPDGSKVAFLNKEAVWVVSAEGGTPRRITDPGVTAQSLTWSPDGKAIICDTTWGGRRNLWMLKIEEDAPPVPLTSGSGIDIYPSITPDWKYLLYTNEHWQRIVWKVDKEGRGPASIQTKTTFETVAIDPAGRWLAYSDYEPDPDDSDAGGNEMGLLDVMTLEQRRLGRGTAPAFSPDGKRLAFFREKKPGLELNVMELATGISRRVTQTPGSNVEPAWSPDGGRIVFQRASGEGNPGLSVVEVTTGAEMLLAEGNYRAPAWSPDGQWVAAVGEGREGDGLYLFNVASREARRISERRSYEAAPIWAADSRSIQILVDERTAPSLLALGLDGAEVSRLALEFNPDLSFWGIFHIKPTPTGYLYLLQRVEGDIYLTENPS